ncbi:LamG domain-containing protein [uncultured Paraglaciecola sp.]|uniref:LamG domain-containing protein n=1 Tax=uncultured Paraglaciecola sp. TaxID=1765024 RepID=UPI002630F1FE|nr:LamG domain-containing protein [uncultured Paraglaciecola sp.]
MPYGLKKYSIQSLGIPVHSIPTYSITDPSTGGNSNGTPDLTDPNLLHAWNFDEGAGLSVDDGKGSMDGTITGAVWNGAGAFGYAGDNSLDFDGSDAVYFPPSNPSFSEMVGVSSDFTVYMWFNTDTGSTRQYMCGDFDVSTAHLSCTLELSSGNGIVYDIYAANGGRIRTTYAAGVSTSTWYFVALTFNNTTKQAILYLNGVQVSTTTNAGMNDLRNNAGQQWNVGDAGVWAGFKFRGLLDSPYVYDDIRTPAEILTDYNNWQAA